MGLPHLTIRFIDESLRGLGKASTRQLQRGIARGNWSEEWREIARYELAYRRCATLMSEAEGDLYLRRILPYLKSTVGAGGSVLDIGAGAGRLAIALARCGFELHAIDPSPSALCRLRKRAVREGVEGKLHMYCGRACDLRRFPDGAFDCCLSIQTLMYCMDAGATRSFMTTCVRLARKAVCIDMVSKYGALMAGLEEIRPCASDHLSLWRCGRILRPGGGGSERFQCMTTDEFRHMLAKAGLVLDCIAPVGYRQVVLKNRKGGCGCEELEHIFEGDPRASELSLFILGLCRTT